MRGHAPNITKKVESVVIVVKGNNPKFTANLIRQHIKQNSNIYKLRDNQIPSARSIQNRLSNPENRRKVEKMKDNSLDKAWSMGRLAKDELSPEAIPMLLEIQEQRRIDEQSPLSIREAKWVSRLCHLKQHGDVGSDEMRTSITIATWAEAYALREKLCYVAGVDCDTSDLDQGLSSDFNASLGEWELRFLADAVMKTEPGHLIKDERTFRTTFYTLATMRVEMEFLRYWLGRPDFDMDSWDQYVQILEALPDSIRSALHIFGREHVEQFFMSLREWVRLNPEWVHQHSRLDQAGDGEIMGEDCSEVALRVFSSITKSEKKKAVVRKSSLISQIASQAGEGFDRQFGRTVNTKRKEGRPSSAEEDSLHSPEE